MPMVHFIDWFPVHCGHCHHWDGNSWMKKALENKPVSITPSSPLRDYIRTIWYFELRISSSGQLWQKKQPWLTEISIFEIRSSASSSGSAHRSYDLESPRLAAQLDTVWDSARWFLFWRPEEVIENIWDFVLCPSWSFYRSGEAISKVQPLLNQSPRTEGVMQA